MQDETATGVRLHGKRAVSQAEAKTAPIAAQNIPDCGDKDEDCPGIENKVNCWLYAPERGMCPYLRFDGAAMPDGGKSD